MGNDIGNLSYFDFENLTRDLLGAELDIRFEAFPHGPDRGMDGRYATPDGAIVLQAKHYYRSGFSKLMAKMKRERTTIDALQAKRYVLATSASLTPDNKAKLAEIIGPSLNSVGDIFGLDDLNALLRKFPAIEEAHPQLWGQSAAVMRNLIADAINAPKPNTGNEMSSRAFSKSDRAALNHLINTMNKSGSEYFLRDFAFGDSFESSRLDGISEFVSDQRPETYFSDHEIERLRLELLCCCKDFLNFLNANIFPTGDPGFLNLSSNLLIQNQDRYAEIANALNDKATNAYNLYKRLILEAKSRIA